MKITHLNKAINLTNNNFLSEGGEGRVYIKNNILFKIFHKAPIPQHKITELKVLSKPNIMIPQNPIYRNNKYIGFSMNYADNTVPLCKLFTNTFRDSNNINPNTIVKLVQNIQKEIQFIHSKGCIIVDGNEFNYLVDKSEYSSPYFIDVDSYQTPNHSATAIMLSIKDWHSSEFTKLTDWFSFAVIACQLFVGIHPFKGNHPSYNKKDLKKRMLDSVSIFNTKTKVPISTRGFSHIPTEYRMWFIDLFEKGNRSIPPSGSRIIQVTTVKTKVKEMEGDLIIRLIREIVDLSNKPKKIVNYFSWNGIESISCDKKPNIKIIYEKSLFPISSYIESNKLVIEKPTKMTQIYQSSKETLIKETKSDTMPLAINAEKLILSENTLFTVFKGTVSEIFLNIISGEKLIIAPNKTWNILPHAHKVLDGFIYQNILGKSHLDFFYKVNSKTNHSIIHIPELDRYRIIDGKHENRVCMIIGFKGGKYDEFILRFDEKYTEYSCIKTEDIDNQDINMTVLDKGLALILEDKKLRTFSNNPNNDRINITNDENLNSRMRLCHKGDNVQFYTDNKLYSLRTGGEIK